MTKKEKAQEWNDLHRNRSTKPFNKRRLRKKYGRHSAGHDLKKLYDRENIKGLQRHDVKEKLLWRIWDSF